MKILVVEDDRKVAGFIEQGLREEGYAVDVAPDGDEATTLAHVYDYDLVVLDVMLPKKNGLQVAAELRREGRKTPILMLTARDTTEDVVRGLDAGADDYLAKPFKFDELLARVRALIRRGGASRTELLSYGPVELDRLKHKVKVKGKKLELTPKEFQLLEHFLLRPEEVIRRTELLEKVWDLHFDPESNVVDVHVGNLRRKLQDAAELGPAAGMHRELLLVLAGVVVVGTGATLVGAWWLAGSAVRPVYEITEQATRIEAGTLGQRIVAHADTDEYRGLVSVLNRMLERIDAAFKNQRRLTADVSHELRSPLTALRGEIEVALRAERTPRDYQRVLRSGLEEIDRLTVMSEDLLLITRAGAGLLGARRVPTDVNALIRRELEGIRGRIEEKQLTVRTELDPGLGSLALDPALAGRLVEELLDNAVKFVPHGGVVVVATTATGGGLRLAVENSGLPLAEDELAHLFEPFYRADQARTRGTGTGLGLAVAAAVTSVHGGSIRAVNVPSGGVRLECELVGVSHARHAA